MMRQAVFSLIDKISAYLILRTSLWDVYYYLHGTWGHKQEGERTILEEVVCVRLVAQLCLTLLGPHGL